jgi:hypothetical protein
MGCFKSMKTFDLEMNAVENSSDVGSEKRSR